jgi:alkyl hydroperoxide reductase subunit AhpC
MSIRLGQVAPDFEQDTTNGSLRFHRWLGSSWGMLFSYPCDFSPVCASELVEVARLRPEWARQNVKPVGLSVDDADTHRAWETEIGKTQGQTLNFPVIADSDGRIATLYDMIHPDADPLVTMRCVFIVDPHKKVRLMLTYPHNTGRNFGEISRAIESLRLTDAYNVATPANWMPGTPAISIEPDRGEA